MATTLLQRLEKAERDTRLLADRFIEMKKIQLKMIEDGTPRQYEPWTLKEGLNLKASMRAIVVYQAGISGRSFSAVRTRLKSIIKKGSW